LADKLLLILLLLASWAFFAGSESAFITVSRIKLGDQKRRGKKSALIAHFLLKKPERLLTTALIGTNISLVFAANLTALVFKNIFGISKPVTSIVAITLVSLLACEILPKNFAIKHNLRITLLSAFPMLIFYILFFPIGKLFSFLTKIIISTAGISYTGLGPSLFSKKEDLKIFLRSSLKEPFTKDQRRYFIDSLDFGQKELADIMIPLVDIQAIPVKGAVRSCYALVARHSKYYMPVYKDRIDNIVGIIYASDILGIDKGIPLSLVMRDPYFVPENKNIYELYHELFEKKVPVVFAVNEYGGVTGMATMYDIGEEILGKISPLEEEKDLIVKVKEGEYLCDGDVEIDDVNHLLSIELLQESFTTLNGLVLKELGRIPRKGDIVEKQGYRFIVVKGSKKRAELIRIIKL